MQLAQVLLFGIFPETADSNQYGGGAPSLHVVAKARGSKVSGSYRAIDPEYTRGGRGAGADEAFGALTHSLVSFSTL